MKQRAKFIMSKIKKTDVKQATEISINPYSWIGYGKVISNKLIALKELIQNGYAAARTGYEAGICDDILVDAKVVDEKEGTYLYVSNNGSPVSSFKRMLDYGDSSQETRDNQNGTGCKTALSFWNPANDAWEVWTNRNGRFFAVEAPYNINKVEYEMAEWPFEEKWTTVVRARLDNPEVLDEVTTEDLGFIFSYAIRSGLNLTYKNKDSRKMRVKPVFPNDADETGHKYARPITSDDLVRNNEFVDSVGEGEETINGALVKYDYSMFCTNERAKNRKYFSRSTEGQGIYIYVNDIFAMHKGFEPIHSRTATGKLSKNYINVHPSMNRYCISINIITDDEHKADIPFNSFKTEIVWENKNGKEYLDLFEGVFGDFVRNVNHRCEEKAVREALDYHLKDSVRGSKCFYQTEFSLYGKKSKRPDAVLFEGRNINLTGDASDGDAKIENIVGFFEYKPGLVKVEAVNQIMDYYLFCEGKCSALKNRHIILHLIGREKEPSQEAMNKIAYYEKASPNVHFVYRQYVPVTEG